MSGYEIMPDGTEIDIAEVVGMLRDQQNPVIDLILRKWKVYHDGYRMFLEMHHNRQDQDDLGMLGVAKLFRAQRDCCAGLLTEIAEGMPREESTPNE